MSRFSAGMEKCESKYERELLLIKELSGSCSRDPEDRWEPAQAASSMPKSNNGNESRVGSLEQIVTGQKHLMAVDFLSNLAP